MTALTQLSITVTLNSVNVTGYVSIEDNPPKITSALDMELDTMTLRLLDADDLAPREWQEISVTDSDGNILFGGYVVTVKKVSNGTNGDNDYDLGCTDHGAYLEKVFVKEEYEDKTDKEILADIFTGEADLAAFDGATYVNTVQTFPQVRFNRKSVREVLNWLCDQTGAHWYCDYSKKLHYFSSEESRAPFDVSDNPSDTSDKNYFGLVNDIDGSGLVNLVEVVGGNKLSDDVTDYYSADGSNERINLSHRYEPKDGENQIVVRRNDGGATTNLVVNPSFESNVTDGWTQVGTGGTYSKETETTTFGTKVLKIIAGSTICYVKTAVVALAPGESITISGYVKCSTAAMAGIRLYNETASASLGSAENTLTSDWERLAVTYTNETSASMNVRLELRNLATDSTLFALYDGVQMEKVNYPTAFCDGSLGTGYAWTGTANNSTSTRVAMAVWTTLTVKTGGTEELAGLNDVLYYQADSYLEQVSNWPDLKKAVEVSGRYEIPIRTRVRNQASYDYYSLWMQYVLVAAEIIDLDVARMRGRAKLAESAYGKSVVSYSCVEPGLKAGMMQHVTSQVSDIDSDLLIQRVITTINIAGFVSVNVSMGAADMSLVKLILKIKRNSEPELAWNDNEVLDEVLDTYEEITLDEGTTTVSAKAGPYLWDDADAVWDFAVWG